MKITTVFAAFAVSSLFATGALAQTMQPIPNPPENERPAAHHVTHHHVIHHHHVVHHVHHVATAGGEQKGAGAANAPQGGQQPK